jgi:hypothetical protein
VKLEAATAVAGAVLAGGCCGQRVSTVVAAASVGGADVVAATVVGSLQHCVWWVEPGA